MYNRREYYDLRDAVRWDGIWEEWVAFFLEGVLSTAEAAVETARRTMALFEADEAQVQAGGRAPNISLRVRYAMRQRPLLSLEEASKKTGQSFPTVAQGMESLVKWGIVHKATNKWCHRVFAYSRFLGVLNEGTESL